MFECRLPVALLNLATECCCSSYSGHVAAPAPSTCLNADSFPVEPEQTRLNTDTILNVNPHCSIGTVKFFLWAGYLQQVCVNELGSSHARGLVELWLKQNGNVLGGRGLLIGQVGLRLAQLWCLHTRIAVQGRSWQHHGGLWQAALHECLLRPAREQIGRSKDSNCGAYRWRDCNLEQKTGNLLCHVLPVRLQWGAEQVLWLGDWRTSAKS